MGTQVTGKITKLFADYNSVVKKGELIAEIDKTLLESEVEAANANLESARSTYEYRKTNYERILRLGGIDGDVGGQSGNQFVVGVVG